MSDAASRGFDPLSLPENNATTYPSPHREAQAKRWNRRLGDHAGLANFGVNITRIAPGGQSSARHWHSLQDEFVYVIAGETVAADASGGAGAGHRHVCGVSGGGARMDTDF